MHSGRAFRAVAAALSLSAALAACGGGSGGGKTPSALDPATKVPSGSVAYAVVTTRPQGKMERDLVEAVDSIAGPGAAQKLSARLTRSVSHWRDIKPWLGQRVGIALTGLPADTAQLHSIEDYVLAVFPTSDPSAARKALLKGHPPAWERSKVEGHYVLVGGANAIAAAQATTAKTSLAADAQFKSDMAELGDDQFLAAYAPLHRLYQQLLPLLKSNPAYSASKFSQAAKQAPPGSSAAFGMSALHNQFRVDVIERGTPPSSAPAGGVATDVSSLPASSWLALTLGGALTKGGTVSKLTASLSKSIATLQRAGGITGQSVPSGPLRFVIRDLLPALGPAELSVGGVSSTTLQAGLVMAPVHKSAGARLARAIKQLVSGLPISATTVGGRVVVTFGFSNLQQLLNPSAKLAGNPSFKHAVAQLPAGGRASLWLNFAPIVDLASLDQSAASPGTLRVLRRLDYLIAGGTHGHFRLVLATY